MFFCIGLSTHFEIALENAAAPAKTGGHSLYIVFNLSMPDKYFVRCVALVSRDNPGKRAQDVRYFSGFHNGRPPSTGIVAPVVKVRWVSVAKTARAISSGDARRFNGVFATCWPRHD